MYGKLKNKAGEISATAFRLCGETEALREDIVEFYNTMRFEKTGCTSEQYEELFPLVRAIEEHDIEYLFDKIKAAFDAIEAAGKESAK